MTKITLSEQMGAMGVVDELRHRQLLVQDLLNLPERRAEVARRLSEYYRSKQIEVSNEVLEQGVKEYFSKRLTFDAPKLGLFARVASALAITRDIWIPRSIAVTAIGSVVVGGSLLMFSAYKNGVVESMQKRAAAVELEVKDVVVDIHGLKEKVSPLQTVAASSSPAHDRMLLRAKAELADAEQLLVLSPLPPVTYESRDEANRQIDKIASQLAKAASLTAAATSDISATEALLVAVRDLKITSVSPSFVEMEGRYPALPKAVATAQQLIAQADSQEDVQRASKAVATVSRLLSDTARVQATQKRLDGLLADFRGMNLRSKEDYAQVEATSAKAVAAITSLDNASAENTIEELEGMKALALTPFKLQVVDRTGVKSGVERTINGAAAGQGKAWYLIVEAVDPAGQAVPLPITSSESGETRTVKYFGLRVSADEYQKVRTDKQADGKVDQKAMGAKPDRTFKIDFNERVHPSHDMILEW